MEDTSTKTRSMRIHCGPSEDKCAGGEVTRGSSDFRQVCSGTYVDRTLMIKDFLDAPAKVTLFTRPPGFGKSVNMSMLRTFFEMSSEDSSVLFRGRKIWKAGERYRAHQGRYPVIFLSFKDAGKRSWSEAYSALVSLIRERVHPPHGCP